MRTYVARPWFACAAFLFVTGVTHAQGILNTNLIVNGNAESGSAGTATGVVSSIPGWTRGTGNVNVLPYNLTGYLLLSNPAPADHSFQYFIGGTGNTAATSTMTQTIDVSSAGPTIGGGNVKFTASAYLGSNTSVRTTDMAVAFQNASGQTLTSITLSSQAYPDPSLFMQEQIGLVPAGTTKVVITVTFHGTEALADSLSLVFSTLATSPALVLGANLVVNPGAESGPNAVAPALTSYVPGWATSQGLSVAPYGGPNWISATAPGPVDRGVNLFCGSSGSPTMYQDLDVSPAAPLIDAGKVTYNISAWLGSLAGSSPTLTYGFFDWTGNQLAPTGQMGPLTHSGAALVNAAHTDTLPAGTRRVHILLSFPASDAYLADDISFTLATPNGPPMISPGGIVSAGSFGGFTAIAPGSWIELYGANLASATQGWASSDFVNGVAPASLGGVSVSIGGQAAFLDFVSPGQIDAQVPSNAPLGSVPVTVTNGNGASNQFMLTVNSTEPGLLAPPSFMVNGQQFAAALFSDGQTFALPQGAIQGVASHPASPGDVLTIYGVGFGPVSNGFTAGAIVTAQNSLTTPIQFTVGGAVAALSYYGLAPSFVGLYQFNVVVPPVSTNGVMPLSFTLGGTKGSQTLYIAVQN